MLTQSQAANVFQRLKKHSTADEIEVLFYGGRSALTRFANNTIHQNVAEENVGISVRTAFDGRTARASTNKIDDEGLRRVVQASENLARVQHSDPDLLAMAGPSDNRQSAGRPSRHFEQTASITPKERAEGVERIVSIAEKNKLTTAGIFATSETFEGIFNTRGLSDWHTQTSSEISVTMLGGDSSGWQKANAPNVDQLDPISLSQVAAEKALRSNHPREIPAGKFTVILEPAAVLDIVGFMFFDYGGLAILDQRSFLNGRVGKKLFGQNINIWDDVAHPLQSGCPFDGEGVGRKKIQLVENGVVRRLVYARATAAKMKASEHGASVGHIEATGHGFPVPNEMGEAPMNIVFAVDGKTNTIEEMIGSTERGILVTRFWYIREVDPYEKIMTGMTRDGTFLVENGKMSDGLLNFRFNESLVHMLSNVEAMSTPVRSSGEESFDMVVPAMKVREFNFTEVTKF